MKLIVGAPDVDTNRIMESARRAWNERYQEDMPYQWELVAAVRRDFWWTFEFEWLERR